LDTFAREKRLRLPIGEAASPEIRKLARRLRIEHFEVDVG
jgi:hypothetical protein